MQTATCQPFIKTVIQRSNEPECKTGTKFIKTIDPAAGTNASNWILPDNRAAHSHCDRASENII